MILKFKGIITTHLHVYCTLLRYISINIRINADQKIPPIKNTKTAIHLMPSEYSTLSPLPVPTPAQYFSYHTAFTPILHCKYTNVK
jgi:hypothetical protein